MTKEKPRLSYQTFNNKVGWQNVASDGQVAGTTGKELSISGIKASVNSSVISGNISYQAHISNMDGQHGKMLMKMPELIEHIIQLKH